MHRELEAACQVFQRDRTQRALGKHRLFGRVGQIGGGDGDLLIDGRLEV